MADKTEGESLVLRSVKLYLDKVEHLGGDIGNVNAEALARFVEESLHSETARTFHPADVLWRNAIIEECLNVMAAMEGEHGLKIMGAIAALKSTAPQALQPSDQGRGVDGDNLKVATTPAAAAPSETPRTDLIYRLHNWCNEQHGDDLIEDAQALMSEAAEAINALGSTARPCEPKQPSPPSIPGWILIPSEPTEEMIERMEGIGGDEPSPDGISWQEWQRRRWHWILGVAPKPSAPSAEAMTPAYWDIVFDGPPGPESGRFVECEDMQGRSFRAGDWIDRGNGLWALRIWTSLPSSAPLTGETPRTDAFYYDRRGEVPVLRERGIHEDIEFASQLERELAESRANADDWMQRYGATQGHGTVSANAGRIYANPQQLPDRSEGVNLARSWLDAQKPNGGMHITTKGIRTLAEGVMLMDAWIREVTRSDRST